jgi:hypothetical protein
LRVAQGIADRKRTMPMLANVLLRTQGKNQLLVAATDLNGHSNDAIADLAALDLGPAVIERRRRASSRGERARREPRAGRVPSIVVRICVSTCVRGPRAPRRLTRPRNGVLG